jgi:hypothetical protein
VGWTRIEKCNVHSCFARLSKCEFDNDKEKAGVCMPLMSRAILESRTGVLSSESSGVSLLSSVNMQI